MPTIRPPFASPEVVASIAAATETAQKAAARAAAYMAPAVTAFSRHLARLLMDEGIPLAWVPERSLLVRILEAPDAASRRRIIGSQWERITGDCIRQLELPRSASFQRDAEFVLLAARALQAGHPAAAQAVAANTLDSLLRQYLDATARKAAITQRARPDLLEMQATFPTVLMLGTVGSAQGVLAGEGGQDSEIVLATWLGTRRVT